MKTVLFGLSGGIAVVKAPELITKLKNKGWNVIVVTTAAAAKMIDPQALEELSGNPVYVDLFAEKIDTKEILKKRKVEHIQLAGLADLILVAPATANFLAKVASGIADDYLTTVVLAARCPVILCPSMNVYMWSNPATQENIHKLQNFGYQIIHPDSGMLACGYEGEGKLAKVSEIVAAAAEQLHRQDSLKGKKIIVTAGGTKEPIDDVRSITNNASGKMGAAIADSLSVCGADVLFVHAKDSVLPRFVMKKEVFVTSSDLKEILQKYVLRYDVIFHSAAVSDFLIKKITGKISSEKSLDLHLDPANKIINEIKQWNPKIVLFAFKAVWNLSKKELLAKGLEKLQQSHADAVIVNDVGKKDRGFGVDTNEVYIVRENKEFIHIPLDSKRIVAKEIINSLSF